MKKLQNENRMTELMLLQEDMKTAPFGDVWSEYLKQSDIPENYFPVIQKYEEKVLKERT